MKKKLNLLQYKSLVGALKHELTWWKAQAKGELAKKRHVSRLLKKEIAKRKVAEEAAEELALQLRHPSPPPNAQPIFKRAECSCHGWGCNWCSA